MDSNLYIIKRMPLAHCARGPLRCEKCRIMAQEKKICLVKVYLEPSNFASPVLELAIDGKKGFYEYGVERVFEDENEAKEYAERQGIAIDLITED